MEIIIKHNNHISIVKISEDVNIYEVRDALYEVLKQDSYSFDVIRSILRDKHETSYSEMELEENMKSTLKRMKRG